MRDRILIIELICLFIVLQVSLVDVTLCSTPYQPKIVNPLKDAWRWTHFSDLEGRGIRCIAEGEDQIVWVSSNDGLLQYDGYKWKLHESLNDLITSPIEQILITSNNEILVTSANGIFKYVNDQWIPFFRIPEDMSFDFFQLKQLSDLSIIACSDWGIIHFVGEEIDFYTSEPKKSQLVKHFKAINWIVFPEEALSKDGDFVEITDAIEVYGIFWFALTLDFEVGAVLTFPKDQKNKGSVENFKIWSNSSELPLGEGQKLLLSHDRKVWIINSTSNKGLSIYDGLNWQKVSLSKIFGADDYMADIVQSANGTIWISSMARIFTFENENWQVYRAPQFPVPANHIILHNSHEDKLWIAGYKSKMLLLDYSVKDRLTYSDLSFQCQINNEEQWFLEADNRVVYRNGDQWIAYDQTDGLMQAPIKLIRTSKGQIWVAGSHNGVASTAVLSDGQWTKYLHDKLSWGIDYRSVFEDNNGNLWFGGSVDAELSDGFFSGLLQLINPNAEKKQWIHHRNLENGLSQANVYGIGQSPDGKLWIGGSKLLFYDGKSWNTVSDERLNQYVNIVTSTSELLLVGSRYYGIFIYDGVTWKNYDTSNGLSSNTIISIDAISDSCIFVATDNGISRFDGTSWANDVLPEKMYMDFEGGSINHTSNNTLWINHVPRSWKRRSYQNKSEPLGNLEFSSSRYPINTYPPETQITYFLESVSPEGNSLISWSGIDYFAGTPTKRLSYSYRIDNGEWSLFSEERQHSFTSLTNGDHILEVRSRDSDFNIDPTPAKIEFRVLPPIWKQFWFISLIGSVLLIFGIYEYRVISKKQKLEILNATLQKTNRELSEGRQRIELQNHDILAKQAQIIDQSKELEQYNTDLESRNKEIQLQKEKLENMVVQVEELSKAKVSFFTNISHELRTPLTLILGPIEQLQATAKDDAISKVDQVKLYSIIHRNASRLLKLINQLLEIRRIEHSALELKLSNIYLVQFLSDIMGLFENLAIRRDIYLDLSSGFKNDLVTIDADKIEKIVVNVLSNAFKNTLDGGSITIYMDVVSAHSADLPPFFDNYIRISIEDTGVGMTKEEIDYIFDKYYTGTKVATIGTNTGIGLSYVRDLVYLMQGKIDVESVPHEGTKFEIYLPYQIANESGPLIPPELKMALQEANVLMDSLKEENLIDSATVENILPKILLVEDNTDMLHFLQSILQVKYNILTANNGAQGLRIAETHNLDLIISDVIMAEMDGFTFCEKVKNNMSTSHIPVILLTAKVMEENKIAGYMIGADDYITKPFNPDLLIIRIENLLNQRNQLREIFNREFMLTPNTETIVSQDEQLLHSLVEMMEANLGNANFNVDKMCKMVHLSHMHFIRKVKQLTGKKPIDLLKSFRMKKAKELLAQQKLTIAEVAYKVGFDLPNSFSRAFKKEFGYSPTQFAGYKEIENEVN